MLLEEGCVLALSSSVKERITLQGTPAAKQFSGISLVTTLPAPITEWAPIETPLRIVALAPIQTHFPILTSAIPMVGWECPLLWET